MNTKQLHELFLSHPTICTDTRKNIVNSLFFALKGDNFDGNLYAASALDKGAAYAIIDDKKHKKGDRYILVRDVLLSLQQLALFHRNQFEVPVLGITGTNGKTTTKELINAVLKEKYQTTCTSGNFNNHIGVPLTLLQIDKNTEIAIVEMGANHLGEIDQLCQIASPNLGLITNIGKAHLEGFGSLDGVIKTKSELYHFIAQQKGELFVNNGNPILEKLSKNIQQTTYGSRASANCRGMIKNNSPFLSVIWHSPSGDKKADTKLYGSYNFENVMAAICLGQYFEVAEDKILLAIENYIPKNQRSEIIKTKRNTIFMDAYNANPSSMELSVREFDQNNRKNKMLILGDMLELGGFAFTEHQNIVQLIEKLKIKNVVLIGEVFSEAGKTFKCFHNTEAFISNFDLSTITGQNILIKGSRGIHLENLLPKL
jgi:UDP-N-acetylmuramoyl-tripeptide--D-alanyl-D-alanine ligase